MVGVGDRVVRGHHQHQRVLGRRQQAEGGDRRRRRGVFTERLEDDFTRVDGMLAQLLGDDEAVRLVADHQRRVEARAGHPTGGFLDHRVGAQEGQELLRIVGARQRPEPAARPTRKNDRRYFCFRRERHGCDPACSTVAAVVPENGARETHRETHDADWRPALRPAGDCTYRPAGGGADSPAPPNGRRSR